MKLRSTLGSCFALLGFISAHVGFAASAQPATVGWLGGTLVFVGGSLAAVGDLWIDAEFAEPPGQPALRPVWTGRPRIY